MLSVYRKQETKARVSERTEMNFVSYRELVSDVRALSAKLPEVCGVVGIPRSGTLAAGIFAQHRNIPAMGFDGFCASSLGRRFTRPYLTCREICQPNNEKWLLLDDSIHSGKTFKSAVGVIRRTRPHIELYSAALYESELGHPYYPDLDFVFRRIDHPRCFEWQFMHCDYTPSFLCDMDGVLCVDPPFPEVSFDPAIFREVLSSLAPLHVPSYPIRGVVTARLTKYGPLTVDWLKRHNVRYKYIRTFNADGPEDREPIRVMQRKADVYKDDAAAILFIESDFTQAPAIANLSKKPVLCTESMVIYR